MERNVILVTFNYRLQAFGFLSLDDPELGIPGDIILEIFENLITNHFFTKRQRGVERSSCCPQMDQKQH